MILKPNFPNTDWYGISNFADSTDPYLELQTDVQDNLTLSYTNPTLSINKALSFNDMHAVITATLPVLDQVSALKTNNLASSAVTTSLDLRTTNVENRVYAAESLATALVTRVILDESNITALGTRLTTDESNITALGTRLTTDEASALTVKNNLTTVTTNLATTNTNVTTVSSNLAATAASLVTAQTTLGNLNYHTLPYFSLGASLSGIKTIYTPIQAFTASNANAGGYSKVLAIESIDVASNGVDPVNGFTFNGVLPGYYNALHGLSLRNSINLGLNNSAAYPFIGMASGINNTADGAIVLNGGTSTGAVCLFSQNGIMKAYINSSGSLNVVSAKDMKKSLQPKEPIDPKYFQRILQLPIYSYIYKSDDSNSINVGPMYEDVQSLLNGNALGTRKLPDSEIQPETDSTLKFINPTEIFYYHIVAFQSFINTEYLPLKKQTQDLQTQLADLTNRLSLLESANPVKKIFV